MEGPCPTTYLLAGQTAQANTCKASWGFTPPAPPFSPPILPELKLAKLSGSQSSLDGFQGRRKGLRRCRMGSVDRHGIKESQMIKYKHGSFGRSAQSFLLKSGGVGRAGEGGAQQQASLGLVQRLRGDRPHAATSSCVRSTPRSPRTDGPKRVWRTARRN